MVPGLYYVMELADQVGPGPNLGPVEVKGLTSSGQRRGPSRAKKSQSLLTSAARFENAPRELEVSRACRLTK